MPVERDPPCNTALINCVIRLKDFIMGVEVSEGGGVALLAHTMFASLVFGSVSENLSSLRNNENYVRLRVTILPR